MSFKSVCWYTSICFGSNRTHIRIFYPLEAGLKFKFYNLAFYWVTLSGLNLPLSSRTPQAANYCRNSRLVVNEDDLK